MATPPGTPPSKDAIEDAAEAFDKYLERQKEALRIQKERAQFSGNLVESISLQHREQEIVLRRLTQSLEALKSIEDMADRSALAQSMIDAANAAGLASDEMKELVAQLEWIQGLGDGAIPQDVIDRLGEFQKLTTKTAAAASEARTATKGFTNSLNSLVGGLNLGITASSLPTTSFPPSNSSSLPLGAYSGSSLS